MSYKGDKKISDKNKKILSKLDQRNSEKQIIDVEEETIQLVLFSLADDLYAFHGEHVKEILPRHEISLVPGAPSYIKGLINVRGDIESVISINSFLGIGSFEGENTERVIIVELGEIKTGIVVDSVNEVSDLAKSVVHEPLSTLSEELKGVSNGQLEFEGKTATVIDLNLLFNKMSL